MKTLTFKNLLLKTIFIIIVVALVSLFKNFITNSTNGDNSELSNNKSILRVRVSNLYDGLGSEIPFIVGYLNKHFTVKEVKDNNYDVLINGFLNNEKLAPASEVIKIFYTSEGWIGDPKDYINSYDLVMGFDLLNCPNYIRVPFSYTRFRDKININYTGNHNKCAPKEKKYFACFLVRHGGNDHPLLQASRDRTLLFHKLSTYKKVISGGGFLNNIGETIGFSSGETEKFLSQCKFTICYENQYYPGYITEKPFQAWYAGTIPIYNADKSVLEDINPKSIIFGGDFKNDDELVEYIKKVDNDDDLYCEIWNQKLLIDPKKDYETLKAQVENKLDQIFAEKLPILRKKIPINSISYSFEIKNILKNWFRKLRQYLRG